MNSGANVIRILLVEDDPAAAARVRELLDAADHERPDIVHVGLALDAVAELAGAGYDVVLLDPSLPDAHGLGAFVHVHAAGPDAPVLILADRADELAALKAVHAGAVDYILKDQLTPLLLTRAIRYAIERGRTGRALRDAAEENARLAAAIGNLATGVVITDARAPDHPIVFANAGFLEMTGYALNEVLGRNPRFLQGPDSDPVAVAEIRRAIGALRSCEVVLLNYRKDGTPFWNQLSISPVRDGAGAPAHFVGLQTDVTDRIHAEEALADRNRELATLHRISEVSLAADSSERSFRAIAAEIARATGFPIVTIELYDEPNGRMICKAACGLPLSSGAPSIPLDRTPSGRVVLTGTPIFAECVDARPELRGALIEALGIRALACVPMVVDGTAIGALMLAHREAVRLDDRLPDFAANLAGFIASLVERTRAQEAFAAEGERLAVTLRSIADGVVATDTRGRVTLMNRVAERLGGWTQAEAADRPLNEVLRFVDERTGEPRDPVRRLFDADRPPASIKDQCLLVARDGAERIVAESVAPLLDRTGSIVGAVLVFRDITRERELEEELLKASKLESLGVLAGGIAHDFNNLLTSILGHVSLLQSEPNSPDARHALEEAETAVRRARGLIQQLLTFSMGGAPIRKRASIAAVIRDAARVALHGSGVPCDLAIPPDLHTVEFDEGQVGQVLGNILLNAVQAMPDGGTVHVTCENVEVAGGGWDGRPLPLAPGDYVRIEIRDEGAGIAPDHLPRIFDPYFTTRPNGSGLGLAAAYSIVRKHGGHIAVRSEPGKGASFDIFLPAAPAVEPDARRSAPPAPPGPRRILVMDDDEVVLAVVRRMLERIGYHVETATDGEAAVHRYRDAMRDDAPFDAVLMDLTVPDGMGGREAVRALLAIDPHARAIVSSGYSNDPVMAEYRAHGFRGVIAKPYDLDELRRIMGDVIEGADP